MTNFNNLLRSVLEFEPDSDRAWSKVAGNILEHFHSETMTIHALDSARNVLVLKVARGVPPHVMALVKEVPVGKGIAGECARTRQPVTQCNIQKDTTGVVQPGAKSMGVGGALCVPILREDDSLAGTLGVGVHGERTYTDEETKELILVGRVLAEFMGQHARA
ncbi:MAG: GAF domain-containing protein [Planctomycetes bacterium]|nr:GAF domain-containing protein [Planctomycetota bacterium]MCC7169008.1 GAF domain-containing protein [Planctomycetota bacterium]